MFCEHRVAIPKPQEAIDTTAMLTRMYKIMTVAEVVAVAVVVILFLVVDVIEVVVVVGQE